MIEFYPNSIYYPREAVDEKLAKGELEKTKQYLMGWTERHRDEIWECAREDAENPSDEILLDNLRALLLCKGRPQGASCKVMSGYRSDERWRHSCELPSKLLLFYVFLLPLLPSITCYLYLCYRHDL